MSKQSLHLGTEPKKNNDYYVRKFTNPSWNRVLDLGCGDGALLTSSRRVYRISD